MIMVELNTECQTSGSTIINLKGKCTLESTEIIEQLVKQELLAGKKILIFNCNELSFIDSTVIATFVKIFNSTKKDNISLIIYGLNASLQMIFEKSALDRYLTIISKTEFESGFLHNTYLNGFSDCDFFFS